MPFYQQVFIFFGIFLFTIDKIFLRFIFNFAKSNIAYKIAIISYFLPIKEGCNQHRAHSTIDLNIANLKRDQMEKIG